MNGNYINLLEEKEYLLEKLNDFDISCELRRKYEKYLEDVEMQLLEY